MIFFFLWSYWMPLNKMAQSDHLFLLFCLFNISVVLSRSYVVCRPTLHCQQGTIFHSLLDRLAIVKEEYRFHQMCLAISNVKSNCFQANFLVLGAQITDHAGQRGEAHLARHWVRQGGLHCQGWRASWSGLDQWGSRGPDQAYSPHSSRYIKTV